jgi:hypothetical protein
LTAVLNQAQYRTTLAKSAAYQSWKERDLNQPHTYTGYRGGRCQVCGETPGASLHVLTLAGMDTTDQDRETARQMQEAQDLTAQMRQPLGDVSAKAGKMERDAPLFFGKGANPGLF